MLTNYLCSDKFYFSTTIKGKVSESFGSTLGLAVMDFINSYQNNSHAVMNFIYCLGIITLIYVSVKLKLWDKINKTMITMMGLLSLFRYVHHHAMIAQPCAHGGKKMRRGDGISTRI